MKRSAAFKQIAKEQGRKEGTVAVNYYYAAKKRGGGKKAAAKRIAAKATKATKATAAPNKAGIAATIYDAIEKLMAGGRMKRSEACRKHTKQTGRKEGTGGGQLLLCGEEACPCDEAEAPPAKGGSGEAQRFRHVADRLATQVTR